MIGELAEVLDVAEADGVRNLKEILKECAFFEMCQGEQGVAQCISDRKERDGT